MFFRFTESWIY